MIKRLVTTTLAAAAVFVGMTAQADAVAMPTRNVGGLSEPKTVRGFERMFDTIPVTQWGAADIGISIRLKDGRRVWLWGDTLIDVGKRQPVMPHSTALVQTGKSIKVSMGGMQLLPNRGSTFYWPETVRARGNVLFVTAAPVRMTGPNIFDIERHPTRSRVARLVVNDLGDVVFKRWVRTVERPEITGDGEDLVILGANHYGYWFVTHDARVRGGWLQTMSQNWDYAHIEGRDKFIEHRNADGSIRYDDFRPVFSRVH